MINLINQVSKHQSSFIRRHKKLKKKVWHKGMGCHTIEKPRETAEIGGEINFNK